MDNSMDNSMEKGLGGLLQMLADMIDNNKMTDDPQEVADMVSRVPNDNEEERFHIHITPEDLPLTTELLKKGDVMFRPMGLGPSLQLAFPKRVKNHEELSGKITVEVMQAIQNALHDDFLSVDEQLARLTEANEGLDIANLPNTRRLIELDVSRIGTREFYKGKKYTPDYDDDIRAEIEEYKAEQERLEALHKAVHMMETGGESDA